MSGTACVFFFRILVVETSCVALRDFELAVKASHLSGVLENMFCGSSDSGVSESRDAVCRFVHDHVHSPNGISTAEVLVLAFHVLQVATRALSRGGLQCMIVKKNSATLRASYESNGKTAALSELIVTATEGSADSALTISVESNERPRALKTNRFFVPRSVLDILPFPTDQLLIQVLNTSGREVVEETCLRVRDICMVILLKVEDTVVVRRCLGIMTEVALCYLKCSLKSLFFMYFFCT